MIYTITEAQRDRLLDLLTTAVCNDAGRSDGFYQSGVDLLKVLEPVKCEPHVWMIQGSHGTWKGEHAEMAAKAEAARCGGTCYAYPLYTHQQRELSDGEIRECYGQVSDKEWAIGGMEDARVFARAVLEKARTI
jgi:hypothetical protein